jgi:hypothetical protein
VAPRGTIANGGRNTGHLRPINDIDLSILKRFNITERYKVEFAGRFSNLFNHPQYVGGYINDVSPGPNGAYTTTLIRNFTIPSTSIFNDPTQAFSSNPRSIQLSLKFIF